MRMYLTSPGWDKRHSVLSREYSDLPLSCHGNSSAWQLTTQTTVHAERLQLARINSAVHSDNNLWPRLFFALGFQELRCRTCYVVIHMVYISPSHSTPVFAFKMALHWRLANIHLERLFMRLCTYMLRLFSFVGVLLRNYTLAWFRIG